MQKYASDVERAEELKLWAHWAKNIQVKINAMFYIFLDTWKLPSAWRLENWS